MPVYIWFPVIVGLTLGFSFMNIPPVADQFMALFGVGYAGLSLFLSGLLWAHALVQIPAGLLVDRIGVVRAFIIAAGLGVSMNLVPFVAPNILALAIAARFLLGVCTGLVFICILKIIGVLAPPEQMAKAQGLYGGSFGFGTMLPYFILPHLGQSAWMAAYLISAGMYSIVLALLSFLPREKFAAQVRADAAAGVDLWPALRTCFASGDIWILGLAHGLFYGTLNNMGQWLPFILADLAKSPIAVWTLATMLVLCLGSLSRSLSGYILRFMSRTATINYVLLATFILYVAMSLMGNPYLSLALGLALAVVCGFSYGSIFTMGSRVLAAVYMGTALGLMNSVSNLVNVGLTLLFGGVREWTGSFALALQLIGLSSLVMWLLFRNAVKRIDKSIE